MSNPIKYKAYLLIITMAMSSAVLLHDLEFTTISKTMIQTNKVKSNSTAEQETNFVSDDQLIELSADFEGISIVLPK